MKCALAVSLSAFLFCAEALAFTDAEKLELQRVVRCGVKFSRATQNIGFAAVAMPGRKMELVAVAKSLRWGHSTLEDILDNAFSAESNSSKSRTQEIADMKAGVSSLASRKASLLDDLQSLLPNGSAEDAIENLEECDVESFDRSLGYEEFRPVSFPRSVGPHGDFQTAELNLEHMVQYTIHTLLDGVFFWGETSLVATNGGVRNFLRFEGRALETMYRAWGMDAEIVLPDDEARINQDVAAGSGLRPFDFFRLLLQVEYLLHDPATAPEAQRFNPSGRRLEEGATEHVGKFTDAFRIMSTELAQQFPEEHLPQFNRRRGGTSNTGPDGWGQEFLADLADFWTSLDAVGAAWMLFFHAIPAPPGGGTPITCGVGTIQVGNECRASVTCPTFVASPEVLIDGVPVACVEAP